MNSKEKIYINRIIKFIKEYIDDKFTISKIDINTELPYYIVQILYTEKNINEKPM